MKRNNKKIKHEFINFSLTIFLGVAFFCGQAINLYAQSTPATVSNLSGSPSSSDAGANASNGASAPQNTVCQFQMGQFLQKTMEDYYKWMDQHFDNKSATTSLLEDAFKRYSELRSSIMQQYALYAPTPGALQQTEGLESGACLELVNKALSDAQKILERKAVSTSSVKKSTALLEKYKKINAQLRVLNQDFVQMKAYLTTFSDKLPCYVKKSCNKG